MTTQVNFSPLEQCFRCEQRFPGAQLWAVVIGWSHLDAEVHEPMCWHCRAEWLGLPESEGRVAWKREGF